MIYEIECKLKYSAWWYILHVLANLYFSKSFIIKLLGDKTLITLYINGKADKKYTYNNTHKK